MNNLSLLKKILLGSVVVFLVGNLLVLNYLSFFKKPEGEKIALSQVSPTPTALLAKETTREPNLSVCPQGCLDLIDTSVNETDQASPVVESDKKETIQNLVKEIFIPLGSGQFEGNDWQLLPGTTTTVNTSLYRGIKSVFLQASLGIPNASGKVEARLYNLTDGYEVWGSHIENQGGGLKMISSSGFELPKGEKNYQLRVRSSIGSPALVGLARLRIILE